MKIIIRFHNDENGAQISKSRKFGKLFNQIKKNELVDVIVIQDNELDHLFI